jgi:hypothetical protein
MDIRRTTRTIATIGLVGIVLSSCAPKYRLKNVIRRHRQDHCITGIIVPEKDNLKEQIERYKEKARGSIIGSYFDFTSKPEDISSFCTYAHSAKTIPYVTLDPKIWNNGKNDKIYLKKIVDGKYDEYLKSIADALRDFKKPVILRWAHEMNGTWYPYSGWFYGGGGDKNKNGMPDGPERYIITWKYIHKFFGDIENVYLFFCPNSKSLPNAEWNQPLKYYPGDKYVDIVGIDVYNYRNIGWKSFEERAMPFLSALSMRGINKPVMIGEFGCTEGLGSGMKAEWISQAFKFVKQSPIMAVAYFDEFDRISNRDFRIETSPESFKAMVKSLRDKHFE